MSPVLVLASPKNVPIVRYVSPDHMMSASPMKNASRPMVATSCATSGASASRRITSRSITAPTSGAMTNTTMISDGTVGIPQPPTSVPAFICQYTKAKNMPIALCAKLKMPDVV